jgi:hypothetical protein
MLCKRLPNPKIDCDDEQHQHRARQRPLDARMVVSLLFFFSFVRIFLFDTLVRHTWAFLLNIYIMGLYTWQGLCYSGL